MQTQAPSDSRPEMAQQTQAHRQKARRIVDFFETLTPAALAQLPNYYSPQARSTSLTPNSRLKSRTRPLPLPPHPLFLSPPRR